MTAQPSIKRIHVPPTATIVLSRPPLNILDIPAMKELNDALQEVGRDSDAKMLILKAEGKAFCAGVDVGDHVAEKVEEMMHEFHRIFDSLGDLRIPSVAVVDGAALGGGCEIALGCDMIVASERAKFGQPEIKVGVFPPVAAAFLPRLIGRSRTLDFLLSGDTMTASEAERSGLVTRVLPVDGFEQHVSDFINRFTVHSRVVLELTKQAIDRGLGLPISDALKLAEDIYLNQLMTSEDAHEGIRAFMEKRPAVWKNK